MTPTQALAELVAAQDAVDEIPNDFGHMKRRNEALTRLIETRKAARAVLAQPPQPQCEKCAESMAKCAEVVAQTHLAGLKGHTKSASCIHREDDPKGCYRVRCQLGNECAATKDPT